MNKILMVPMHLDALVLKEKKQVVEATADFTRLPFVKEGHDENPNTAGLSENVLNQPFENLNLYLEPGVHLHWALPDALAHGTQENGSTRFRQVPNRWLITRSRMAIDGWVVDREWVVESDYVHPEGEQAVHGAVSIPQRVGDGRTYPYRFLGRCLSIDAWMAGDPEAQYLSELTALGYGEPTFAAFFPNCHSVFGFHDEEADLDFLRSTRYEVVGFYDDGNRDAFRTFLAHYRERWSENNGGDEPDEEEIIQGIERELEWEIPHTPATDFPDDMLCYARMGFTGFGLDGDQLASPEVNVVVGNTATEALSAMLGAEIGADAATQRIIEEQFEALNLDHRLQHLNLDLGAKFKEARHAKGFSSQPSGVLWTIRPTNPTNSTNSAQADGNQQVTLPEPLATRLNRLNTLQARYDIQRHELESLRKQLFSDWYKYMVASYPPMDALHDFPAADQIRWFLEKQGLADIRERAFRTGILVIDTNEEKLVRARAEEASPAAMAFHVAQEINVLQTAVSAFNAELETGDSEDRYLLQPTTAPRYWQPNEPVLLLHGDAIRETQRHGQDGRKHPDGLLACQVLESNDFPGILRTNRQLIRDAIQAQAGDDTNIGFHFWKEQPWHPIMLEWQVTVLPALHGTNRRPGAPGFKRGFVEENYDLQENEADLSIKAQRRGVTGAANTYEGATVLSPRTNRVLRQQLESYLLRETLPLYLDAHPAEDQDAGEDYFQEHKADILAWYEGAHCAATSLGCRAIEALRLLGTEEGATLSQALSGFNDALLMQKQTLQLEVGDNLAFPGQESLVASVKAAVAGHIDHAPLPLNDFNPIRSGACRIEKLRLVDSFGRYLDVATDDVHASDPLVEDETKGLFRLAPRIVQPARLNFRWLSARDGSQEMNVHPASSPVCGWVLPNNFDRSLMVYDQEGVALGSVQEEAGWLPFPGSDTPVDVADIDNEALREMVQYLLARDVSFRGHFLEAVNSALNNIDPEDFNRHQSRALLMGRPVALVRSRINLEVKGLPAVHQGWNRLRKDMGRNIRDRDGATRVEFPIRLGEYEQLNDGVLGYWIENETSGFRDDLFYAVQSDPVAESLIVTRDEESIHLKHSIDDDPIYVSMLMDPRGKAHLTSGILPVKSLEIPEDQYRHALTNIQVAFLAAPLLMPPGEVRVALPAEPGYTWSWLEKRGSTWEEIPSVAAEDEARIGQPVAQASFSRTVQAREGWLRLSPNEDEQ